MDGNSVQILVAMVIYMAIVIAIGVVYAKRANKSSEEYFLGGRSLGPWVTAMSAEASDMSGWLLMGLPGVAYWCGLADAFWTAFGLAIGTYLNWLIVSKRLRRYSVRANNAITLPEFFSNRFREKKKTLMFLAAAFILIFFTVYAASCFVTCGKLFSTLFGMPYVSMMILGAVFVLLYTLLGGFLAESASDFMQAIVMIVALTVIVVLGTAQAGGINAVLENARQIPGFLEFFGLATPVVDANGQQLVEAGQPLFGEAADYGLLSVCSMLAWGLGYFGMPHILLRFMAIEDENKLKTSRRVASVWVVISMGVAVLIGVVGYSLMQMGILPTYTDASAAETIIVDIAKFLSTYGFVPAITGGIILAGILASTMSTADSQLLAAASSVSQNLIVEAFRVKVSTKTNMIIARVSVIVISIVAIFLAADPSSSVFRIVSFAWAGFGAAFGPVILCALFWKRANKYGAISGMIAGGVTVFIWKFVVRKLCAGTILDIYELLPAFIVGLIVIVVVSLLTPAPSLEITNTYEEVKENCKGF